MTQIIVSGTAIVWHGADGVFVDVSNPAYADIGNPLQERIPIAGLVLVQGVSLPADYTTPGKVYTYVAGNFVDVTPPPPPATREQIAIAYNGLLERRARAADRDGNHLLAIELRLQKQEI